MSEARTKGSGPSLVSAPVSTGRVERSVSFLTLFTSMSTLVCCALPALFVALGAGAVFAGIVSAVPQLIWLSEKKLYVFAAGGILLGVAGVLQWRARNLPCPIDPKEADACTKARRFSVRVYFVSLAVYAVGALFAFALVS